MMTEPIEELQKKLEEFKRTPEGIARSLQIDLSVIAWGRMLDLNWTMAELAARTSWSAKRVQSFLNAEESTVGEIGVIMHAMGLQITFATRLKTPQPQPTDEQNDQPIEQKDRPEPTPFQEYMGELPDLSNREYDEEAARLAWNRACGQMRDHLRKEAQPEIKLAAFYTLADQVFCSIAEPKPAQETQKN